MDNKTMEILRDFHKITGGCISIYSTTFDPIAIYPKTMSAFCTEIQRNKKANDLCVANDKAALEYVKKTGETYIYTCHCGLIEVVAPIYNFGVLSGYIMMGQITNDSAKNLEHIFELSKKYFTDTSAAKNAIDAIPKISESLLKSYINTLTILAEYLTYTNRIYPNKLDLAPAIKQYLNRHYAEKITIESLCDEFSYSRATLMNCFKKRYKTTVIDYLTNYRLEKAENELRMTTESIKTVAINCGFQDNNYFSKIFLKHYNMTPVDYRKRFKATLKEQNPV